MCGHHSFNVLRRVSPCSVSQLIGLSACGRIVVPMWLTISARVVICKNIWHAFSCSNRVFVSPSSVSTSIRNTSEQQRGESARLHGVFACCVHTKCGRFW